MKILAVQSRMGIGDTVIFLPFIKALSKKFNSPISILVKENSKANQYLHQTKYIDKILILERDNKTNNRHDGFFGIFNLATDLKKHKFDKIFIFNSSLRYNLVARLAGIKSINQYPLFKSKDNIVLSAKVFTEAVINKVVSTEPNLIIKEIHNDLDKNFKHICLGISASGPTKRWDISNYIKLAEKITEKKKCKFYIAGGEKDYDLIKKFKNSKVGRDSFSFEKLSIRETLQIISDCTLYIGNDTGWAHISVALKVNALTIFCDSPVLAYGRYSTRMFTIEPEGERNTTTHDTLGKDKISFEKVLSQSIKLLN